MNKTVIYDDVDMIPRQMAIDAIEALTIPSDHPFRELGLFGGLRLIFLIAVMPFYSVRTASLMTQREAVAAIKNIKVD